MVRRHYLVSGRVQGVGFRNFIHHRAVELGLGGAVRNLSDGRVEILALGEESAITSFDRAVARGPVQAYVAEVKARDVGPTDIAPKNEFAVLETGEEPWSIPS